MSLPIIYAVITLAGEEVSQLVEELKELGNNKNAEWIEKNTDNWPQRELSEWKPFGGEEIGKILEKFKTKDGKGSKCFELSLVL